jgi:diguanylate cyclase (GGDEF)-like protein
MREYLLQLHDDTDHATSTERDAIETCILLTEVAFIAQEPRRLREVDALRKEFPERLLTVLVGEEDDFKTRLRSVRFGADAFVPIPLDISTLIDKLEATLKREQDNPYHVLIVDDDPEQVSDTALALQNAGMITSVVTDPQNIFRVLVEYKPELILMDMYMPECNGSELSAIIRQNENFVSIPIVFLSVETDAERQLEAIRSGADDFIVKPFSDEHLVTSIRIRAARTRAMRFYMERDSLTGLLNHTNLKQRLGHEMQRSRRIGIELVFAMIDIDKFKGVNDTYGHLTGDRVIKSLARLLGERLRRTDIVGRYGGEEFGIILFNTTAYHAERIMNEIRESFALIRQNSGSTEFPVTFSCGIAEFPRFETAQEINEAADTALYKAKQSGRNRVVIAEG